MTDLPRPLSLDPLEGIKVAKTKKDQRVLDEKGKGGGAQHILSKEKKKDCDSMALFFFLPFFFLFSPSLSLS